MTQTATTITVDSLPIANSIDPVQDRVLIYTASATDIQGISRNVFLGLSSQPLGLTDSQSPQNKTFDNTNSLTVKAANLVIQDGTDATKQAKFIASGITTGNTRSYTLPDYSATLATLAGTETLTNKTLTSPTINAPTITNATLTADVISGFTTAGTGTIYGLGVAAGAFTSSSIIPAAAIQTNAVTAPKLAINAIQLGYTQVTSSVTTTSGTTTQATGLTTTVTIPAGGRSVKITVNGSINTSLGSNTVYISIWDGTVGSGTRLQEIPCYCTANTQNFPISCMAVVTPAAGSKTYNVGFNTTGGTATINATTLSPAFILVECI